MYDTVILDGTQRASGIYQGSSGLQQLNGIRQNTSLQFGDAQSFLDSSWLEYIIVIFHHRMSICCAWHINQNLRTKPESLSTSSRAVPSEPNLVIYSILLTIPRVVHPNENVLIFEALFKFHKIFFEQFSYAIRATLLNIIANDQARL